MSPSIYLLTISLPCVVAIIVFAMKYAATYAAARARAGGEEELRAILSRNSDALERMNATLQAMDKEMARQSGLLINVDTMLREVG